jgi:hypothetical protein
VGWVERFESGGFAGEGGGCGPGHVLQFEKAWMAGSSPGMT